MACQYQYKGKTYSEPEILKAIANGEVVLGSINQARENLRNMLGMQDEDIELVHGLIANQAVGQFQVDGRILLSDMFIQGDEYHEAFHRVFRMMLDDKQRKVLLQEYKNREGYKESLREKRKLYPDKSTDVLIEELLADEFMDYQLANGDYIVPKPVQNFFQRLLNFIRKMLGLQDIEGLYRSIRQGAYKTKPVTGYAKDTAQSRLELDTVILEVDEKNEIVEAITGVMLNKMFDIIAEQGSFDNVDPTPYMIFALRRVVQDIKEKKGRELAAAIANDMIGKDEAGKFYLKPTSKVGEELRKRLSQLNIKLSEQLQQVEINEEKVSTGEDQDTEVETIKDEDDTSNVGNDYAFMKASWEEDPANKITRSMKLLASSLIDEGVTSPKYKLPVLVSYNKVIYDLMKMLKDSPQSWDEVSKVLEANKVSKPWVQKILDRLGGIENVQPSPAKVKLRNQFLTSLNKVYYEMYKDVYVDESLQQQPLDEESLATSQIRDMKTRLGQFGTPQNLLNKLQAEESITGTFEILTGIKLPVSMLSVVLPDTNNKTVGTIIVNMATEVKENLRINKDLNIVFDSKVEADKRNVAILGSLRRVLKVANKVSAGEQAILLNHNNDRVYPFTLPTYQKQIEAAINNVIDKVPFNESIRYPMPEGITSEDVPGLDFAGDAYEAAFQLRVALLKKSLPFFVEDPFNFYQDRNGVYHTNSKILRQTLQYGAKYNINLFTGMSNTEGVDAKNLLEPDITAAILRSAIPTEGETRYLNVKHGDRGALFAGSFDAKIDYLRNTTTEKTIDYLITLLSDELRVVQQSEKYKVFKNMGVGKLRIFDFLDVNIGKDSKLTTAQLKTKYEAKLKNHIKEQEDDFIKHIQDTYGRLTYEKNGVTIPVYLSAEMYEKVGNTINDPNRLENFLRETARKYLIHFHEDLRVFTGYIGEYPDMANLFKRIQSLSSSGTPLVNDNDTNTLIIESNNKDVYTIGDVPKTYGDPVLKRQGLIKEKALVGPVVSYTKEEKEQRIQLYKDNLIKYEKFPENIALQRAKEWASAFDNYEEADGVTYTNMFFYREYKQSLGQWTQGQENTFQVELAILNQNRLNPVLFVNDTGTKLSAIQTNEYLNRINIFDVVQNGELNTSVFNTLEPFTMLKPVYAGPVTYKNATVNGLRKTAFHVVLPSMTFGTTKLKQIHDYMLLNDVDIMPLDSAAKKAFPVDAETIDNDAYNNNEDTFSLLRRDYLLEQVAMSNEEKGRIKDATQSTTIMMSNLFNNDGIPKDYDNPAIPFTNLDEQEKLNSSAIYKKIRTYQQARAEVVFDHIERVKQELGINESDLATKIDSVKNALLRQVSQPNLVDAVESMDSTIVKYVDLLTGSNRLEPVLFGLVSNNAIRIKRPGEMYAQFSVYGLGSNDMPGERSRRLNDYKLENGKVIPAEVIVPLPKSMVSKLLMMTRSTNVADAIRKYNDGSKKIMVKSLRIPNQQLSFNGIYQIKEFALPTMQNYIVLPSEIVPVSSSDFDIDKQQVYWPILDNQGNVIEDNIYNKLLKAEMDLILIPENFHTLLTPVNESWLSKDLFKQILIQQGKQELEGLTGTQLKKALEDITIPLKFKDAGNLAKHIINGVNMAQSKINVGLVANNAKQYPISMLDRWESTEQIKVMEFDPFSKRPKSVIVKNRIPLSQDVRNFYRLHDNKFRHITESISTFLTAQVDGVKNPYAMLMNIGKNTIGPLMLMIRRGVDADIAVKVVASPIVIKYSKAKDLYDSVTINAHRLKKQVNEFFLTQSKINQLKEFETQARQGTLLVTEQEINMALKDKNLSTVESLKVLALHQHNELLNREHLRLGVAVTPDTKPMVNRSHLESTQQGMEDLLKNNLIKQNPRDGFLQPAYLAQDLYNSFDSFFYTKNFEAAKKLSELVNGVASRKLGKQNFRARQTIYNDFKAFMFVRKMLAYDRYKDYTFDNLLVKGSLVNDIVAIKNNPNHKSHNNYFIKNLEVFEGVAPNPLNPDTKLKLLELKGRGSTPMHLADVYDQFQDLDLVLQEKFIAYNIYVTGFGFSKFMMDDAILSDTFNSMASNIGFFTMKATAQDVNDFSNIVAALNPTLFYRNSFANDEVSKLFNNYRYKNKQLSYDNVKIGILGNNYAKRYAGTPEVSVDLPVTSKSIQELPEELKNQCEGTPKAEDGMSFGFTPGSEWEVIKDFKGPSHEYGGIDILVEGGKIKMSDKDGDVKAPDGLAVPNNNTL
jgi:hypothetical protein